VFGKMGLVGAGINISDFGATCPLALVPCLNFFEVRKNLDIVRLPAANWYAS
jgi:hypothetical protein